MLSADFSTETLQAESISSTFEVLEEKKKKESCSLRNLSNKRIILSRSRERISQTSKTCKEVNTKPILEEMLKCLLHIQKKQEPLVKKKSQ